jgi:hypothetical protein
MKKIFIIVLVAMVIMALIVGGTAMAKGGKEKSSRGVLDEGLLMAYGSSSYGPNYYSGRIWEGYGQIEGIGKAVVRVSAAWDWGWQSFYGSGTNWLYTNDHHGALIVTQPVDHTDTKGETEQEGDFTCEATVNITDEEGDQIFGNIVGGSVYELEVWGGGQSNNEWLISFEIVGGTGKYSDASGTGVYRMTWESGPGNMGITFTDGGYVDPLRFHEQEIFLRLK